MRRIKISVGKFITRLSALCLGLLGFSQMACDSVGGDTPVMYGTPNGEFEIKGMVTDEADKPVVGAKVVVKDAENDSITPPRYGLYETDITDENGEYRIDNEGWPYDEVKVLCYPESNELEPDSVKVDLTYKGGSGGFNEGKAEETVNFKLKSKKE